MISVMDFFVMNIDSPYNAIMGRNWLSEIKAVVSLFHQKVKFSTPKGVCVMTEKHEDARFCFNLTVRGSLYEKKEPDSKEKVGSEKKSKEMMINEKVDVPKPSNKGKGTELSK